MIHVPSISADTRRRAAFTLVELLVVVSVIAVLMGLLVPALSSSRRTAQVIVCKSNLRQLAIGFSAHAADHDGVFCTGPSDNRRRRGYGAIDEFGWLADLANKEYARPGDLLCPTSPARYNQNLNLSRLNEEPFKTFDSVSQWELVQKGINSNYTLAWYTGYSEMRDVRRATLDPKRTSGVKGPLDQKYLGRVAASLVPLLATGRTDFDESFVINGKLERATKQMSDGPVWDGMRWNRQTYVDFGPTHGEGSVSAGQTKHGRVLGNIGFADGHAESFKDTNRDGVFGHSVAPGNPVRLIYDELEGRVFGGQLTSGEPL